MSMSDEGADVVGPGADATAGQGGPPAGPPGAGAGGPPQGGGPIMAALARRMQGPQPSAPGPGDQAQSMTQIMDAIARLQAALHGLPPGSPMHRDVLQAVTRLSRHVSQGQPTAGIQATNAQDSIRNIMRNALLQRIMGQQGQDQGQSQGAPGAGQPSTPLPGA